MIHSSRGEWTIHNNLHISNGTLLLSEAGRLGSGAVTNNAALVFSLNSNLTVNNVISGSGSVTQSGAGVLTLSTANSYTGNTRVTASSGNLVFTFRRIHSTTADTTQIFQYGADLSGWTDVPVVTGGMVAIQPDTPQAGTDTVTITVSEGTAPRIFGRLKVSTPSAQP